MDKQFKKFLDEMGIPDPQSLLTDETPPEPVDEKKLRAFHNHELDGAQTEWVAHLISRYRSWYDADMKIVVENEGKQK